jgi:TolB-like protein/Tfp pilus assembly protein PilF
MGYAVPKPILKRERHLLALAKALPSRLRKLGFFIMAVLLVAIGALVYGRFHPNRASATSMTDKSIAVLPFEDLSDEKTNAYFADGIQDGILARLAEIAELKVISRTSTLHYKSAPENLPAIARQLGVANILEGSVQKSGNAVRVNFRLVEAATDSHLWAASFDRKLTDIFSVESDVAKTVAAQMRVHLTAKEEQVIGAKPTENPEAYDVYLRALADTRRTQNTPTNYLSAQKYLRKAVRLDPQFPLAWALLSYVDARGYHTTNLQQTAALREEARQSAEIALALEPQLAEAWVAKGYYNYSCANDFATAIQSFEQAKKFLPNSSRIPESLALIARDRGQWDGSDSYFKEAERLDPRNVNLLTRHAQLDITRRHFPDALRKLDLILEIAPGDVDASVEEAAIAQAEGDLPRASALLDPLHPAAGDPTAWETLAYQAILERHPTAIIPRLKEVLANPDPALGYLNGELRFWLGWAQEVAGDDAAAQQTWAEARRELESLLIEQPENASLVGDLALVAIGVGDETGALSLAERGMAARSPQTSAADVSQGIEIVARVAARMGQPDRAIAALEKILSIPGNGALATGMALTPALLRLDPMFDPLRNDPRFQKLVASPAPIAADK